MRIINISLSRVSKLNLSPKGLRENCFKPSTSICVPAQLKLNSFKVLNLKKTRFGESGVKFYSTSSTTGEQILDELYSHWKSGKSPEKFNFSKDVFDRHAASRPSATALWFDNDEKHERKWTFSDLQKESIRAAIFLRNHLGLENSPQRLPNPPPYVLTVLSRTPEWWFLHLAAIRIGIVFSPGTTMLSTEDIQYRLDASRARMIITDEANMGKIDEAQKALGEREFARKLKKVVVVREGHKIEGFGTRTGWVDFNKQMGEISERDVKQFQNTDTRSDDLAQGYFTSGTTGKPKMVAHTHSSYGLGHCVTARVLDLKENDVMWNISDPGWAKSSYSNFFAPWTAGATVYIHQMERFEAKKVLKALGEQPITNFCAPPTLYKSMVQENKDSFKFKNLRFACGAGEPVSPAVAKDWEDKTGIFLTEAYGQTEMVAVDCEKSRKEESIGVPNGFLNLKVVDDNMNICEPGTEGQIALTVKPVRPIGLFKGYLKMGANGPEVDEEKHKSCFIGDYYLTGDRGFKDESGHLFFVGRGDDVINSAGYRIGPTEIESVLQTHPAVVESAAVATPDEHRVEVVKAFIVLTESYANKTRTEQEKEQLQKEIQEYVKKKTAPYKYPRKVEFVTSLPKTVSGKILRRELKRMEFEKYGNKGKRDRK